MAAAGLAEVLGHHERGVALASWLSRTPLLREAFHRCDLFSSVSNEHKEAIIAACSAA